MQKTAYEMRIGDWSSDVCSSDLSWRRSVPPVRASAVAAPRQQFRLESRRGCGRAVSISLGYALHRLRRHGGDNAQDRSLQLGPPVRRRRSRRHSDLPSRYLLCRIAVRSEEHTSELHALMRNSYAVFCLKNKNKNKIRNE